MYDPYQYPKLRWPLDVRVEKAEGQEVIVLNCPIGISSQPMILPAALGPVLSCFEGKLSVTEIVDKFREYQLSPDLVQQMITLLDEHLYLATPRFDVAQKTVIEDFRQSPVRAPALAGRGYPAQPDGLRALVDGFLASGQRALIQPQGKLVGLVSPHIDYRRGGACYGLTYHFLKAHTHDLYILIGTAHQYSRRLFHLTAKDFATPLGVLPCDTRFIQDLASRYGLERSFADELLHRREHSLELQTPFLKRVSEKASIVPILVGSFHKMLSAQRLPSEFDEYESFVAGLAEVARQRIEQGARLCVIAGVDMAHVGRQFGDKEPLSAERMQEVERRDRIYLQSITQQDKRAMFAHIAEDEDQRRICGFPTMYTVIDLLDRLPIHYRSEIFEYKQAVDYSAECAVTFAGVGLYQ